MSQRFHRDFLHVRNSDGAENSICMRCLALIGVEGMETQLETAEVGHACLGFNFTRILHPELYLRQLGASITHEAQ